MCVCVCVCVLIESLQAFEDSNEFRETVSKKRIGLKYDFSNIPQYIYMCVCVCVCVI